MNRYKRIGIVGGVSPQSSMLFYKKLIEKHFQRYQDQYYPEIVLFSVNFDRIKDAQKSEDKTEYILEFIRAIDALEKSGADFALIASNTPHRIFKELDKQTSIKLLSLIECVANFAEKHEFKKVLLLGTIYTMKETFYKDAFLAKEIQTIVPSDPDQEIINDIIFNELVHGKILDESKSKLLNIVENNLADAVVLGCTELPLILQKDDLDLPVIDTTDVFADATLNFALK